MFSVDVPETGSVSCHHCGESEIHTYKSIQPNFIFLIGTNGFHQENC